MNEVKTIHLGRYAFTVAADAYSSLHSYLADIKKWAGKEVGEEVELRMAELLLERGITDKKVVLASDIEYLREQLGEPKDFAGDDTPTDDVEQTEDTTSDRRIYRDTADGLIGGVAAGLGRYFGISAWIFRIIFVALTFAGASGVLAYLLLWLLVPEAKTPSDRLRMSGKPVTVESIKAYVAAHQKADGSWDQTGEASPGVKIVRSTYIVLSVLIGIAVLVTGLISALFVIGAGSYAFTNPDRLSIGGQIFPVGASETGLLLLGLLVGLLISVLIAIMGLALVRRRWPIAGWVTAVLVGCILVGSVVTVGGAASVAPRIENRLQAMKVLETKAVAPFDNIIIRNGGNTVVTYVASEEYKVTFETYGKIDTSKLQATVDNKTLTITSYDYRGDYDCVALCLPLGTTLHITVYTPNPEQLRQNGEPVVDQPVDLPYAPVKE